MRKMRPFPAAFRRLRQRHAVFVEAHRDGALRGDGHAGDARLVCGMRAPKVLAGFAQIGPIVIAILLGPARCARVIGLDAHLRLGQQLAGGIENHRPHTLRALIDGQEQVFAFAHLITPLFPLPRQ